MLQVSLRRLAHRIGYTHGQRDIAGEIALIVFAARRPRCAARIAYAGLRIAIGAGNTQPVSGARSVAHFVGPGARAADDSVAPSVGWVATFGVWRRRAARFARRRKAVTGFAVDVAIQIAVGAAV